MEEGIVNRAFLLQSLSVLSRSIGEIAGAVTPNVLSTKLDLCDRRHLQIRKPAKYSSVRATFSITDLFEFCVLYSLFVIEALVR